MRLACTGLLVAAALGAAVFLLFKPGRAPATALPPGCAARQPFDTSGFWLVGQYVPLWDGQTPLTGVAAIWDVKTKNAIQTNGPLTKL